MLLYVEKEMNMKVLRGFSAIIIGIFLVSCADQYNASERFVAERGVQGIKDTNVPQGENGYPGGENPYPGNLNGGSNGNYPADDCYEPGAGQNEPGQGDCEPVIPPIWNPPVNYPPVVGGPIYPPISYPPVGIIPLIPALPPIRLPGGGIIGGHTPGPIEITPGNGQPSPEICAYKCTGITGDGAGMEPMYASMDPYTKRFTDKSSIWQAHEGGDDKLVCLDLYTIGGTWRGNALKDWNHSGGDLYSYDPANNCERSPEPIGERGPEGCFVPETKILMANGLEKAISEIRTGDKVWNPALKKALTVEEVVKGPEKEDLYVLGFAGKLVTVTKKHPFVTKSGAKQARDLSLNDEVQDSKGEFHKLEVLKKKAAEKNQEVWNLVISSDKGEADAHLIVADGVAAGDLKLQRDLAKKLK